LIRHGVWWWSLRATATSAAVSMMLACASVPKSVKDLAQFQSQKTNDTATNADQFIQAGAGVAGLVDQTVSQIDRSMQGIQVEEAKFALTFSSPQNLESKTGIDATAAAYMIGKLYLADQEGLAGAVKDQFTASTSTLTILADKIKASWKNIQAVQKTIDEYSQKSSIAAIDPNFLAALGGEIPGGDAKFDDLLTTTKDLKQRLDQASALGLGKSQGVERARSTMGDLVDLLEAVSKNKGIAK